MIRARHDTSPRQCYSKRRTEKLKSPDAKLSSWSEARGRLIPDISRTTQLARGTRAALRGVPSSPQRCESFQNSEQVRLSIDHGRHRIAPEPLHPLDRSLYRKRAGIE